VQTTPRIYLVFWGSSWTTTAGDPYGVASRLHYLYQGLGGSSWANVLKQYSGTHGSFTNPSAQYEGWIRDTTPVPANPTRADIQAAVQRAADRERDYSVNAQLDGVTINAAHEYAESVTDPGLNGWTDSDGSENGDKCAWTNLGNRVLANGYAMAVQPTWSNQWRAQYGYGCYFS
jgi:hypothetical protein